MLHEYLANFHNQLPNEDEPEIDSYEFRRQISILQSTATDDINHTAEHVRGVLGSAHALASFDLLSEEEMKAFLLVGKVLAQRRSRWEGSR